MKGVMWSALQKYSTMAVSIIVTMVMARLLTPEDFGIIAIAMVIIAFLSIVSSMGIGPAIIQKKDLTQTDIDNIFSFTVYVGVVLSLLLFFSSWPIASFYQNDLLRPICQLLCVNVFFSTINMVPTALMSKNKRFKEVAIITVTISVISGAASIISAYHGFGVYSLLITPILTSICVFLFNYHFYPVTFQFRVFIEPLRRISSYSLYQFAFQFVGFFSNNIDRLIIGKYISNSDLGYYDKAHTMTKLPLSTLTGVLTPILHPYLSEYQSDVDKIKKGHNIVVKFLSTIAFPVSVIMFFCASEIVFVFFGAQWERSVMSLRFLSLTIAINMILSTSGAFWLSTNSTKLLFGTGLLNSTIVIIAYIVSSYCFGTIEAVSLSYLISCIIIFVITYVTMYNRVFKTSSIEMWVLLINPFFSALILVAFYYLFDCIPIRINVFLRLFIKVLSGLGIVLLYIQFTGRYNIVSMVKNKKIVI